MAMLLRAEGEGETGILGNTRLSPVTVHDEIKCIHPLHFGLVMPMFAFDFVADRVLSRYARARIHPVLTCRSILLA